jgi:2-polyprenyl-3-methyl-5-hydroxy-6-metoxy-1,4-benzoquinol methylase
MEVFDPKEYKNMVKQYQEENKPLDWFDTIYKIAHGDHTKVFWADLEPSPYLINWLEKNIIKKSSKKAIVIGCGVGDDAEALSKYGFEVTAFDISPTAIELCKNRYPNTKVNYLVANLFDYDKSWFQNFDLVYECNTIQVLPGEYRIKARVCISNLVCKDGYALVSCRSRAEGKQLDDIPLPLDKKEIDKFKVDDKLEEISFLSYNDNQTPRVPHFFAVYKRVVC